jgi:hypothetical protein
MCGLCEVNLAFTGVRLARFALTPNECIWAKRAHPGARNRAPSEQVG